MWDEITLERYHEILNMIVKMEARYRDEARRTRILMKAVAGFFFIFFALSEIINNLFLLALMEIGGVDTSMILAVYIAMIVVGGIFLLDVIIEVWRG